MDQKSELFRILTFRVFLRHFMGQFSDVFRYRNKKKSRIFVKKSDTSQSFCGSLFLSSVRVPVGHETCRTMICSQVTCDQEFVILWFETFWIICQIANLSSSMIKIDSTLMTLRGRLDFVSVTVPGITILLASSSPV